MNAKSILLALAASASLALPALAQDVTAGQLTIGHPYVVATPKTAQSAAGYFSVTNSGPEPDTLTAIESTPMGMLHETATDANGVARMGEVEQVEIAPGQTVTLRPRAMHVMFTGLEKPLLVGDTIPATLVFEKAGPVEVVFKVQSRADSSAAGAGAAQQGAGHEGMDHGAMPGMKHDAPAN
jgi:copper(I)-binding protein